MATFSWKDAYCVGDATIDSQHQYLFALANALVDAKGKEELTDHAIKLFRYVREHFDHEEAVMRRTAYPAYRAHVALHDALITQLSALSSDIGKGRWSLADLEQFMNNWIFEHIVEADTKLAAFVRKA